MPLQISEIGIQLAVGGDGQPAQGGAAPAAGTPALSQADLDHIVNHCVAEVMRQLKQQEAES